MSATIDRSLEEEFEKDYVSHKFGKVCKCGKRHVIISTPGKNLPKSGKIDCDEK